MAKISELPQATSLDGNEIIPIVSVTDTSYTNLAIAIRTLVDNILLLGNIPTSEEINTQITETLINYVDSETLTSMLNYKADKEHSHDELYAEIVHTHDYNDLENLPTIPPITQEDIEYINNQISELWVATGQNTDSINSIIVLIDDILASGSIGGDNSTDGHSHSNLSVLNTITLDKTISWDNKSEFSGLYEDLLDKPSIPSKTSELTNDSGFLTSHQDISNKADKSELHTHDNKLVLDSITSKKILEWDNKSDFDGNYNSLVNKPVIPTKLSELSIDIDLSGSGEQITVESNAFITPSKFGAKGDGIIDDTEAIKQCVEYCQENRMTMVLNNNYLISDTITITDSLKIVSYGGGFDLGGIEWSTPIIKIEGSLGESYTLSDDIAIGSSSLPIVGLNELDWILLKSNKSCLSKDYPHYMLGTTTASVSGAYYGEFNQVSGVSDSGVELFGNIIFPTYTSGSTVSKVNFVEDVTIENLRFYNGSISNGNHYVLAQYGKDCKIINCSCEDATIGNFTTFLNCLNCIGENNVLKYKVKEYTNYYERNGFKIISSQGCTYKNCTSYNGTQPFDITYTGDNVASIFCKIDGCKAINSAYTCFTTHPATYRCSIINCEGTSNGDGISVRGRGHIINNNSLQGASMTDYGICLAEGCGFETVISNNNIKGFGSGLYVNESYSTSRDCSYTLPLNSVFSGNIVSMFNIGIRIDRNTSSTKTNAILGVAFVGNVFKDFIGDNKYLIYITGNSDLTASGISFKDNLVDCVNSGVYNSDNVQSLIRAESNVEDFTFLNNNFINIPSTTMYIIYGTTTGRTFSILLGNNGLKNLSTANGTSTITILSSNY